MRYIRSLSLSYRIQFILLIVINISYVTYWSIFSVDRFYSLHAYIFDLGVAMESGWLIFHTHWTLLYFFQNFYFLSGRILLSPLFIVANYPLILIVQTIAISSGSAFVFLMARRVLKSDALPILFASSYLIYFPLAGTNFFDFHYQVFFIPFFLAGYYYYLRERYVVSIVLLTLSGLFRFPYMAFPVALAVIEICTILLRERRESFKLEKRRLRFLTYGLITFSLFLILGYLSLLSASSGNSSSILGLTHGSIFSFSNVSVDLDVKVLTVVLILGGLLFLPLKSKYMILTLPFFFFVFTYDYKGYYYPNVFQNQYGAALVPFLFIALIDVFKNYYPFENKDVNGDISRIYRKIRKNALKEAIAVLVVLILFAQLFQPYGTLNAYTEDSYGTSYVMNVSMQEFSVFREAVDLIPKNTPASEVLVQGNVPFVYPLPADPSSPLSSIQSRVYNDTTFFYNYTEIGSNGKFYPIEPKYVVMYPYGSYGPHDRTGYFGYVNQISPYPNNLSNFNIVTHLMDSGDYGILAEADGLFILERGYHGPLKYYVPFSRFYSSDDFIPGSGSHTDSKGISIGNSTGKLFFYGPPTALSPGNYSVTYYFKTSSVGSVALLNLTSIYDYGIPLFSNFVYAGGANQSSKSGEESFTFNFSLQSFTCGDEFNGFAISIKGSVTFLGIRIVQNSPP